MPGTRCVIWPLSPSKTSPYATPPVTPLHSALPLLPSLPGAHHAFWCIEDSAHPDPSLATSLPGQFLFDSSVLEKPFPGQTGTTPTPLPFGHDFAASCVSSIIRVTAFHLLEGACFSTLASLFYWNTSSTRVGPYLVRRDFPPCSARGVDEWKENVGG